MYQYKTGREVEENNTRGSWNSGKDLERSRQQVTAVCWLCCIQALCSECSNRQLTWLPTKRNVQQTQYCHNRCKIYWTISYRDQQFPLHMEYFPQLWINHCNTNTYSACHIQNNRVHSQFDAVHCYVHHFAVLPVIHLPVLGHLTMQSGRVHFWSPLIPPQTFNWPQLTLHNLSSSLSISCHTLNPLNAELNLICRLLALLGAHHFLHVSWIRVKSLTLGLLMSYIYIYMCGAPILDVSRSHTTTHQSR